MRAKMSREDRAKQFMPFAALKGYEEALKSKERVVVDRKELSEERKQELDDVIYRINKQDIVTAVYYDKDEYLKVTGMVSKVDFDSRYIQIVNTKIKFEDVYMITIQQ